MCFILLNVTWDEWIYHMNSSISICLVLFWPNLKMLYIKKRNLFYLVVKSQRAWVCFNRTSCHVCCVSCRSCMYWKRISLTSLPSPELATIIVRHEFRIRFTECQPISHIHVKMLLSLLSCCFLPTTLQCSFCQLWTKQ